MHADTEWMGCPETWHSTPGCAVRGSHVLKHWPRCPNKVTLSAGEAEFGGATKRRQRGLVLALPSTWAVGCPRGSTRTRRRRMVYAAAAGLGWRGIWQLASCGGTERLREGTFTLHIYRCDSNPADLLTECIDHGKIEQLLQHPGFGAVSGRAVAMPRFAAEVAAFLSPTALECGQTHVARPASAGEGRPEYDLRVCGRAPLPRRALARVWWPPQQGRPEPGWLSMLSSQPCIRSGSMRKVSLRSRGGASVVALRPQDAVYG